MSSKTLLITNLNNHYRDPLFRLLREQHEFDFLFYSDGGEPYWIGDIEPVSHLGSKYCAGFWIGRTRVVPELAWHLFRSDHDVVVCTAGGKFALPLVWLFTRLRRRRLVLWTGVWQRPTLMVHRLARPAIDWMFRHADAVIAYGSHVARTLIASGVRPDRIFLAPQAINNSHFLPRIPANEIAEFRSSIGLSSTDLVLLYVGRLVPSKGVDTLLQAFAAIGADRGVTLLIAGSGSLESSLRKSVERLEITEQVKFIGRRPNAQLPLVYQSADIVVVPSEPTAEGAEPWGLVVNEAMASGAAVVVSDAVGAAAHGLPANEQSGRVFHAGDTTALATALRELIHNAQARAQMQFLARRQVQHFTYDTMATAIEGAVEFARLRSAHRHATAQARLAPRAHRERRL